MAIYNLGSVNIDHFYALPHMPAAGETLHAAGHNIGLGGKGTNQSVAAAKAGATVFHIGAIGVRDVWVRERLVGFGVDCSHLRDTDHATGHAIIYVDADGENCIVLENGANHVQDVGAIRAALKGAAKGDLFLLQNETDKQAEAAELAASQGLRVVYSAAPFDVDAIRAVMAHISLLAVNEVEAAQLCTALGCDLASVPVPEILVTRGAEGATWRSNETGEEIHVPAPRVTPVDTTAAGDTYLGYVAAGLDLGKAMAEAMGWAAQAAALKVTRHGTADAIPSAAEVAEFSK